MRFKVILLIFLLIILVSVYALNQKMFFTTADNKKIAYDLYKVKNPKGWLILVHMMPATKESWNQFSSEAQKLGYESLAIDLRGHGESEGGPEGYKNFSDAEHQSSIKDLEAAWEFLKSRGAVPDKTTFIGASIGANLSLKFFANHPDFKKAALLSPGLNYHGLQTEQLVKKLSKNQSIVFATSKDDGNNAEENQKLYQLTASTNKHLIIFDNGGHGTNMFQAKEEYDLTEAIMKFLDHGSIN